MTRLIFFASLLAACGAIAAASEPVAESASRVHWACRCSSWHARRIRPGFDGWQQLAQILLLTNELMFVD